MDRRDFVADSLLSMTGSPIAGQSAHPSLTPWATKLSAVLGDDSLPDLGGAVDWLNTAPLKKQSLRGRVVLVNFWSYSCINSLRPLPYLRYWAALYKDAGLVVLGVHTPEFGFEKHRANVEWAVREFRITFPVAMDNKYRVWHAFQSSTGRLSTSSMQWGESAIAASERAIRETESVIRALLKNNGAAGARGEPVPIPAEGIEAAPGRDVRTPETYVGYRRAERFSSPERVARDSRQTYTAPARLGLDQRGLSGAWEVGAESGLLREARGNITLRFQSRDLHLVLGPAESGKPVQFRVTLEGAVPGSDAGTDCSSDGGGEVQSRVSTNSSGRRLAFRPRPSESSFSIPACAPFRSRLDRQIVTVNFGRLSEPMHHDTPQ